MFLFGFIVLILFYNTYSPLFKPFIIGPLFVPVVQGYHVEWFLLLLPTSTQSKTSPGVFNHVGRGGKQYLHGGIAVFHVFRNVQRTREQCDCQKFSSQNRWRETCTGETIVDKEWTQETWYAACSKSYCTSSGGD